MTRIKCTISYDGTGYAGFQSQPNQRTVQGVLEQALKKFHKGTAVKVHGAGRTDAGVHAKGQVFHFETDYELPEKNWEKALNTLLPEDVYIHEVKRKPEDFHARYHAVEKEYHYFVSTGTYDVFKRNYAFHVRYALDMEALQAACDKLIGTHDFTTFSSAKATVKGTKVRSLYEASFTQQDDTLEFVFRGSGFLYNMVRIMVGVLLDVARGKYTPDIIDEMLDKKDHQMHRKTAPPQGLYLWKVGYDKDAK